MKLLPINDTASDSSDDRKVVVPMRHDRDAVAGLARQQINNLYASSAGSSTKHPQPTEIIGQAIAANGDKSNEPEIPDTYRRTHGDEGLALSMGGQSEVWENYHSAWQSYYQQYYQRYYLQQLSLTRQKLQPGAVATHSAEPEPQWLSGPATTKSIFSGQAAGKEADNNEALKPNQAVNELKSRLLAKIKQRATTVKKSHHFMPLISAVSVGLLFMLVQYNQLIQGQILAYISPGSISSQSIIVDPTSTAAVGPEPRLIIPKINVDAPVVYGVGTVQEGPIQEALQRGVVNYPLPGATSVPGQIGNSVILGHSSNDVFAPGDYKFVFALLERMEVGDTFYSNYQGKRYTYKVTKMEVIRPSEVGKLIYPTNKPLMTLVTCVPVGTAANRLLVTAEQISPDPAAAAAAPAAPPVSAQTTNIPGNNPTLFERLFGR